METDLSDRLQFFKLQVASAVAMVLVGLVLVHVVFRRRPSWLTGAAVAAGAVMVVWVGSWDAFLSTAPLRVFFVVAFLEMLRVSVFALLTRELEAARRLQLAMLPQRAPEVPGVDIAYRMVTATEVGGDYVDFRLGDGTRTLVAFGDAVLMMTDGVIEAVDAGGEPFGYDRAAAYLASCACESAEDLVAGLMDTVARYTDGAAPGDDVTVLALAIG